jgi:hypothetical protein
LPTTLLGTITGGGICNGTYILTFNPNYPFPEWVCQANIGNCVGPGLFQLTCDPIGWLSAQDQRTRTAIPRWLRLPTRLASPGLLAVPPGARPRIALP